MSQKLPRMKRETKKTLTMDIDDANQAKQWSLEVLKQFRLIFKATQQHSQSVETKYGVTSAQLWAMWELSKSPGLKVTDLAKAMSIHHSTACSLLDKLAKKGLIVRERVSQDQRVVTLNLTSQGVDLIDHAPSAPQGILQHALFYIPGNVLKSLATNLDVLVKAMEIKDEEAAMQPINPISISNRVVPEKDRLKS